MVEQITLFKYLFEMSSEERKSWFQEYCDNHPCNTDPDYFDKMSRGEIPGAGVIYEH